MGSNDFKLYAINPDASLRWSYDTQGFVQSSPAIASDGTVYVGSNDANLYAINPNGTLKWTYESLVGIASSPSIGADGTVYVGSDDKNVYAVGFVLIALAILIGVGSVVFRSNKESTTVTARSILERISDQYFIVTKSAYIDQESTMTVDKGSKWSNFFWGQTVEAEGVIRIDVGVDLSQITEEDIIVDHKTKTVRIDVPPADILNASQYGDIEVESDQGVLKYLLDNDPNEDHNRALEQLVADAKEAVRQDQSLFDDARQDSSKLLYMIVSGMDYKLIISTPPEEA